MYIVTEWSKPSDLDKMGVNCQLFERETRIIKIKYLIEKW
jgi:hypothetical protein